MSLLHHIGFDPFIKTVLPRLCPRHGCREGRLFVEEIHQDRMRVWCDECTFVQLHDRDGSMVALGHQGDVVAKPVVRRVQRVKSECLVKNCACRNVCRGLCNMHARRYVAVGSPDLDAWLYQGGPTSVLWRSFLKRSRESKTTMKHCSAESCLRPRAGNGLCAMHLARYKSCGEPAMKDWLAAAAPTMRNWDPFKLTNRQAASPSRTPEAAQAGGGGNVTDMDSARVVGGPAPVSSPSDIPPSPPAASMRCDLIADARDAAQVRIMAIEGPAALMDEMMSALEVFVKGGAPKDATAHDH